ncbi:MAG: hypothetical protein ACOYXB_15720 [Bacteroidota bacterium]
MDFTVSLYREFLDSLKPGGYNILTFGQVLSLPSDQLESSKFIILRHDVDLLPENSLYFARLQHSLGIKATYFFRIVPESFDEQVIRTIAGLGHEIGYHYEDMDLCNGDADKAIQSFEKNLKKLRALAPVSTICMHGSPRSPYDNRDLWKKYSYRDFGLSGEPYFDLDFTRMAYYTDTGRRWDGHRFSVRDKEYITANTKEKDDLSSHSRSSDPHTRNPQPVTRNIFPSFHSTFDLIAALHSGTFPSAAMLTFHPQRWTNRPLPWLRELLWQNTKNVVKYFVIKWS